MDFKAVISNSGDEKVYKLLSSEVERRLPSTSIEWKRSYGRPSKQVVLQANFSKFDTSNLLNTVDSVSSLSSKPLLHIFWTSCLDNDTYKSWVKNNILRWQKQLKEHKTADWFIVHVVYQDNLKSGKSKIQLPRSSVYDKIKTEFGQKSQDRCVQLWEPDKETLFTKSGESWDTLLTSLRNLLLDSFGRQLDSFEDRIRLMREKYADPSWSFIDYFVVHEELALIYQGITLKEDALVQYDEVDALLSQFIINCSGKAPPQWLQQFCMKPSNWDGVSLHSQVGEQYRTLIKSGKASLLEFRNYLFARQCKLLIKMKRKWEIPSRLLEFLFAMVHELKLLQVDISNSTVACWIVLTCMQLFHTLENVENKNEAFLSTMAQLHDYMRQKLHLIGEVTGLYYSHEQTEYERNALNILITGFGKYVCTTKDTITPVLSLKSALSSHENFETLYLEVANKSMKLFTDIKRFHFGMVVGIDLAKFHLQHGRYLEAEPLLEKAWSVYKQQRWETLYTDVLVPLADCQLKHSLHERYLNSVTLLSCAQCLPLSTRQFYSNELIRLLNDDTLKLPIISTEPVFKINDVRIDLVKSKGHIGDTVNVSIKLRNELPEVLICKCVSILLRYCDLNNPRSFSDSPLPRKAIFDQTDYGMQVSLSSEKPKENVKEPLTPSNILKRIKSHKQSWSRNKNTPDLSEHKTESKPRFSTAESLSKTTIENGPVEPNTSVKKALFSVGDNEIESLRNHCDDTDESMTLLLMAKTISDLDINKVNENSSSNALNERSSISEPNLDETKLSKRLSDNVGDLLTIGISDTSITSHSSSDKSLISNIASEKSLCSIKEQPLATSSITDNNNEKELLTPLDLSDITNLTSTPSKSVDESSIFVEPDAEQYLDHTLKSIENFTIKPGDNEVKLSTKITVEGRFVLQCISCVVGHLCFYKLLELPRNCRAFFMVADPPKIAWTTDYLVDYLLTGSKQRLHVTVLNGPGVILEKSQIQVSSKSGLLFYPLSESSVQVFPLERDGIPREAAIAIEVDENGAALMQLPACKPYERINVYFDVIAPVHRNAGETSMMQHEINFSSLWLKDLVNSSLRLDCIFYEPFQVKEETFIIGQSMFVKVTLCGVNPVHLMFSTPELTIKNAASGTFQMLSSDTELRLFGDEEHSLLWKGDYDKLKELSFENELDCLFKVEFKSKDEDEYDHGCFNKTIRISVFQDAYSVQVAMKSNKNESSKLCEAEVTVTKKLAQTETYRLFLMLDPADQNWKNYGNQKIHEVKFLNNELTVVQHIEVVSELSGYTAMPSVVLSKLHALEAEDEQSIFEILTQFQNGEIEYISSGSMVKLFDSSVTEV